MRMLARPILITTNQTRICSAKLTNLIKTRICTASSHHLCLNARISRPISLGRHMKPSLACTSTCPVHSTTHRPVNSILHRPPRRALHSLGTGPKWAWRQSPSTTRTSWTTCSTRTCWRMMKTTSMRIYTITVSLSIEAKISDQMSIRASDKKEVQHKNILKQRGAQDIEH